MARDKLSPSGLSNKKPDDGKNEKLLGDGGGLHLRLRRVGAGSITRTWQFIYTDPITGARQKLTLGAYPENSLASARAWAEKQRTLLARGEDPKAAATQEEMQKRADQSNTLKALLAAYVAYLRAAGKVAADEAERVFRVHVPESLLKIPAKDITPAHISTVVRKVVDSDKGRTAGKLRAYLHAAFKMAIAAVHDGGLSGDMAAFVLSSNPVPPMPSLGNFNRARDRALSGVELLALIRHLEGEPRSDARDLLLLAIYSGGQRLTQLLRATLIEEGTVIRILDTKGVRKQPRIHLVPMNGKAMALVSGRGGKLFNLTEEQIAAVLDACGNLIERIQSCMQEDGVSVERFTSVAIRKTAETRLAELGVSKDIRAQLQSHGLSGVQDKHYDKHTYLKEKRQVLESWESYLSLLANEPKNVITLKRGNIQ